MRQNYIRAQKPVKNIKYRTILLGISITIAATTSYALITPETAQSHNTTLPLPIPVISETPSFVALDNPTISFLSNDQTPTLNTSEHIIKSGETLSVIFEKLGISSTDMQTILQTKPSGQEFASLITGKKLTFKKADSGQLKELRYEKNPLETLSAKRSVDNQFDIEKISKPIEKRVSSVQITIQSSLFLDGKKAGLTDNQIMQLANIFGWDIDFALNLRQGDQITVVFEKLFVENTNIGIGNILSAEFVNRGKSFTAVRFENENGHAEYFSPEGKSLRKAFLRTPVDFARISSKFNLKRKHPVLNKIRAHKGVDYAANIGTAVKSTGDGKIIFRGRKGGYGRVVIVQHGQKYSTLYAHLSKFRKGHKVGSRVKQGQIIGYVGKSGLATGPHLHYEFLINGVHRNPLTVKLPDAAPVKKDLLAKFKQQTEPLVAKLFESKSKTLLVKNTP